MRYSNNSRILVSSWKAMANAFFLTAGLFGFMGTAAGEDGDLSAPVPKQENVLGRSTIFGDEQRLPIVTTGQMTLPRILAGTTALNGSTPKEFLGAEETSLSDLPESGNERDSAWIASNYQFAAANTFSHPRYFEDRMLERHGHERFPHLQPMVSGARFFATFPMLPYLMTVRPAFECESQLGYFRPGDCVYPYLQRPPYQRDAVIVEGAAIAGGVIAIP